MVRIFCKKVEFTCMYPILSSQSTIVLNPVNNYHLGFVVDKLNYINIILGILKLIHLDCPQLSLLTLTFLFLKGSLIGFKIMPIRHYSDYTCVKLYINDPKI